MQTQKEYITAVAGSFDEAASGFLTTLGGFDESTINRTPSNGGWTAGQVGEHLLKSYGFVETMEGNTGPAGRPAHEKIEMVKSVFLNFEIKLSAAPGIQPSASPKDRDLLLKTLGERMTQIRTVMATKDLTALCTDEELPVFGTLTRLEWVYLAIFHTRRHTRQLENLMKEAGAPGNSGRTPDHTLSGKINH